MPVVHKLAQAGFQTTVLSRDASHLKDLPAGVAVQQVDYDSDESLQKALQGQDAVVSTVAMSGILNQKRMIDAAIAVGVKYFIPAEYTLSTRDPAAQWLPTYATVLEIQSYLAAREHQIKWMVINCGCLMEFTFDTPFVVDFDARAARIWDGGDGAVSFSTFDTVAQAVVGVLRQPERVQNHGVRVHGGSMSQNEVLRLAKKYSEQEWTVQEWEAEPTIKSWMDKLSSGAALEQDQLVEAMFTLIAAATFGKGHFDGAYSNPDNEWLGVETFAGDEIEEAIRLRVTQGKWAVRSGTDNVESLKDVSDGLAKQFGESK